MPTDLTPSASQLLPDVAIFQALADPTRHAIYERVCEHPRHVGALAAGLPVSRPAVSQHLRVLEDARLVRVEQRGTRRVYSARAEALHSLRAWVERHWDVVLGRFAEAAERAEKEAAAEAEGTTRRTDKSSATPKEIDDDDHDPN